MVIYTPREMNCLTEDGPPRAVMPGRETETRPDYLGRPSFDCSCPVVCIWLKFLVLSSLIEENVKSMLRDTIKIWNVLIIYWLYCFASMINTRVDF